MNRRALLHFLILLFSTVSIGAVHADDNVASSYLHYRNMLSTPPGTLQDLMSDQNNQSPTSRYYELSGQVVGQVASSGQPIVLIQDGTYSAEVSASQAFLSATDWMGNGSIVRVLVKSVPSTDAGSPSMLVLIAAGPELSVSALEKVLAADDAKIAANARARAQSQFSQETSRSAYLSARYAESSSPVGVLSDRATAIYPAYYGTISRLNPRLSPNDAATITKSILYYADAYQLDPRLIVAMVTAESGFDPYSVSRTGAVGLGQLMPETASDLGVTNAFDPQQNIAAAVELLSSHVQRYGGAAPCGVVPINTLLLSMAAYNAGPGAVKKYGGVPPYRETQNYVRKVNEIYQQLCGS